MATASVGTSIPLFIADYRAGRAMAESGRPLPENAAAAIRTGYHIRHEPTAHVAELSKALGALPQHEARILGTACLSTIAKRLPVPADEQGRLAHAALVSALVAVTR